MSPLDLLDRPRRARARAAAPSTRRADPVRRNDPARRAGNERRTDPARRGIPARRADAPARAGTARAASTRTNDGGRRATSANGRATSTRTGTGRTAGRDTERRTAARGADARRATTATPRRSGVPARRPAPRRAPARVRTTPVFKAGSPNRRLWVIAVFAVLAVVLLLGRVAQLQLTRNEHYSEIADRQRVRVQRLPAARGAIVDRNGVELAVSVPQHAIYADPSLIVDPVATATLLGPLLGKDSAELASKLSGDGEFVYLKRQVDDATKLAIDALRADEATSTALVGVGALSESKRFLPAGDVARAVIGSVDPDGVGQAGMEKAWHDTLAGTQGELRREVTQDGRTIATGDIEMVPSSPGSQVVLTIDRALQYELELATADYIASMGAQGGMVIVQEVATGDVLAVVNVSRGADQVVRPTTANLALTAPFEPGSVNKLITVAKAIDEGLVASDTSMYLPNRYTYLQGTEWEKVFTDSHTRPDVSWPVSKIVTESSNVGVIRIAELLKPELLDEAMRDFGLGATTGSSFPAESKGIYPELDNWSGTSLPTIAIGQGVAVTALQMVNAYTAIANGGTWVSPRLVSATIDADGTRHDVEPSSRRRVVSEQTAATMIAMLRQVVSDGTGRNAAVDGYTVAGKTGTALKAQPNGTYEDEFGVRHYVSSFAGMLPAEAPVLSILAVVDDPPDFNYYAGDVAAPLFKTVAQESLRQLRIPPIGATLP